HNHYDHLDRASVRFLLQRDNPIFLVPLGLAELVRQWGSQRVVELDWWEFVDYAGARFHCTPARHFSGRGLNDRNRTLWASWYVETPEHRIYFGGDTGYGQHFAQIRQYLGAPELVLLPIGAYEPRWFMQEYHIAPDEALRAFLDLKGIHLLPIHWGTFDQADEGLQEPPYRLRDAARRLTLSEAHLHILPIGGSLTLTP
ncbi:MAG: MBL fold metallo-hydrolase, partial [Bacteroidota bacterium]|nr:MBL fold metallo-hydrolase [Bacteroidota bacterium]